MAESVRLDRWLWAARFFKTRRLAVDAIKGGKVEVDGVRAKPARAVRAGNRLLIRKGPQTFEVDVEDLAEQRGPAPQAQALYTETDASVRARERQRDELRAAAAAQPRPDHRPDRRDRQRLAAFKRGGRD
ncbi:RNA-binding S4 domain-containing protein [Spiribacter roseus]|uniref:RNA-binding S4 domain-containing protein n=1 Tax=Spiribacter roseus TaxID=1855875 RepID=UPI00132F80A2|nr:S4 domain-containing protein [Spiribacter roseus]KAF0284252.1 RNA-binding protein [Spiribacter roseus]